MGKPWGKKAERFSHHSPPAKAPAEPWVPCSTSPSPGTESTGNLHRVQAAPEDPGQLRQVLGRAMFSGMPSSMTACVPTRC